MLAMVLIIVLGLVVLLNVSELVSIRRKMVDNQHKLDDLWYWRMDQCPKPSFNKD